MRVERQDPAASRLAGDILAGGILFLLTLAFFWRTLSGDVYQPADGGDLVSFLYPTYRFAASQVSQWILPLWNPHLYGGAPFVGDIQAGFLYPPNLLLFFINPAFPYETLQWLAIGHLYWAGLGMYALLRTLRFDGRPAARGAALLGALAFQFSDALFIHLGNLNLIAVLAWMPWIFVAYWLALERRSLLWAAAAAVLFAVANYAGHAQSSYYIGLALAVYTLVWLAIEIVERRQQGNQDGAEKEGAEKEGAEKGGAEKEGAEKGGAEVRQAGWLRFVWERLEYLVVVVLLTVLLTAPILLPAYELTSYTERQDLTYQESIAYSLAPTQAAVGFFTPGFFGRGPALHWSLWDRVETPYVGIVTLILAVLGFALASKGTRRRLWPWLVLALFGLLVSLGVYGILHGLLTVTLPGFDQFRAPARAIVLWAFGISVMGAVGADVLAKRWMPVAGSSESGPDARQPRERGVTAFMLVGSIVFVGLVVPILFWALLVTQGDQSAFLHASLAALSAVIAAGFWLATWAVLAGYRTGWFGSLLFGGLLVALLFLELTATGAYTDISSSDPTRGYQHPEIVEFLRADPGIFRIDARTDIDDLWQPDTAALAGLQDVWGIANPLMLRHWNALWEATGGRQTDRYDMLNARYVLVRDGTPLPEGKFELAFDAPGELSIYRNDRALPRAWLVHEVIPVQPGAFDAANLGDLFNEANFEPRTMALVETDDAAIALAPAAGEESVSIRTYASSHMALDVEASAPSLLVLSEVWYPGWRAVINGQSVDVLRANGALRAVPVPAGASTVELRFAPSGWRYGLLAFCVGIVVLVGIVLWGIRQPRRLEWHSDLPGQA